MGYIIHSTLTGIRRRIKKIEKELEKFEQRIESQRKRRAGKIVSLTGYTNAGKTTLLNTLTGLNKETGTGLFTTLSTKTSLLSEKIFINDTIGFLQDLPSDLIYAFKATLSEIKNSDLILLVLDVSETVEKFQKRRRVCMDTLRDIGATGMPTMLVLNKIDLIPEWERNKILEDKIIREEAKENYLVDIVPISALHGEGVKDLKEKIIHTLL